MEENRENSRVKRRRKYDPDFMWDVVIMTFEEGRTVKAVAKDLGIAPDILSRWRREYDRKKELAWPFLEMEERP